MVSTSSLSNLNNNQKLIVTNKNQKQISYENFYVDSGANRFATHNATNLQNSKPLSPPLKIKLYKQGEVILATMVGDVPNNNN